MNSSLQRPLIAIACGGTGGHLFPGLAVAEQLHHRGCEVALLISPKEVDQQAIKTALATPSEASCAAGGAPTAARPSDRQSEALQQAGSETGAPFEVFTLPAVGLQNRNYLSFAGSFIKSLFAARSLFRRRKPRAVLAMGGFTSAPPVFVAKELGLKTFLHESNTIPGRANRILARFVDEAFVGFPEAGARLKARRVTPTGTPVRPQFQVREPAACRLALGLEAERPVILVMGGSQGASGLNTLVLSALPWLTQKNWQWLHLTGAQDFQRVKSAYAAAGLRALVKPFLGEMELALGAATAGVSRAGASSLAEIAALRLPSLLVPFPAAADNHQFFNARIYTLSGAARLLEQKDSTPQQAASVLVELVEDPAARARMDAALGLWHAPQSAEQIATHILRRSLKVGESPASEEDTQVLTRGQAGPKKLSTV